MGEAPLEHMLREMAGTLVAETPLADTVRQIAVLACDVVEPVVSARLELVDGSGRPIDDVSVGVSGGSGDTAEQLSAPLIVAHTTVGSVTLFAQGTDSFTAADKAALDVFAAQAAVVVANARAYWELHEVVAGLQAAMQSRAVIEQAKGWVMAKEGGTADEAFTRLARTSQRDNVKLRDLARLIVDGTYDRELAGQ
jgi:GAF domain-containing protein